MKYILLVIILNGSKNTSVTAEYNSKEACVAAATVLTTKFTYNNKVIMCSPKGK